MKITKKVDFAAAHSIAGAGICERKHGHNWEAIIEVESVGGKLTDERGFLCDVKDLKQAAFKYDHDDLDLYFEYASTENVAQKIAYDALHAVETTNPELQVFVRVHLIETKNNSADAVATNVEYKKLNKSFVTPSKLPFVGQHGSRFVGLEGAAQDLESEFDGTSLRKPEADEKLESVREAEKEASILFGGHLYKLRGH